MVGRVNRRKVLAALGTSGIALGGVTTAIGTTKAWETVPIAVRCPSCERLGKIDEVNEDDGPILGDGGSPGSIDGSTYSFDTDGDGVEESVIEVTDWSTKDDGAEKNGFDITTNGVGLCRVDVKGGSGSGPSAVNEYRHLGTVVRGTDFTAPHVNDDGVPDGVSNIEFYHCPTVRVCVLSSMVSFEPGTRISVTSDEVRLAVWWGPRHFSDQYLFDNGAEAAPLREIGDKDDDGTTDLCFDFSLRDAVINDPRNLKNPDRMKLSFLVRETDEDNDLFVGHTQDGIVVHSPEPE